MLSWYLVSKHRFHGKCWKLELIICPFYKVITSMYQFRTIAITVKLEFRCLTELLCMSLDQCMWASSMLVTLPSWSSLSLPFCLKHEIFVFKSACCCSTWVPGGKVARPSMSDLYTLILMLDFLGPTQWDYRKWHELSENSGIDWVVF